MYLKEQQRHGAWPRLSSGTAEGLPGLTWQTIDTGLIPKSGGELWCVVECALRE
jgi:hypothetical protein